MRPCQWLKRYNQSGHCEIEHRAHAMAEQSRPSNKSTVAKALEAFATKAAAKRHRQMKGPIDEPGTMA
ncbi:hypothetical protein DPEC_G00069360 [Dallia pectoralis]|uniref:Uncharacterized protein n=1 Tax=Dallia pectoralis TaxID=75939 RepID=A0ACC2H2J5_DALPE|nr:hypothetical protein DPEC_G00069360 [Dallia pectoralis]